MSDDKTPDLNPPKDITSMTAKPTCRLRWVSKSMLQAHDLKLQQAWEITRYVGARPTQLETEWRDVPVSAALAGKEE